MPWSLKDGIVMLGHWDDECCSSESLDTEVKRSFLVSV